MSESYRPSRWRTRGEFYPSPSKTISSVLASVRKGQGLTTVKTISERDIPVNIGRIMHDYTHDRFKERQGKGQIFNDPMSMRETRLEFRPFTGVTFRGVVINQNVPIGTLISQEITQSGWLPDISGFPIEPPYMETNRKIENAVNSAFAKAHQRYVNFLTDLGEAKQTGSLIKSQLSRLDRMLNKAMTEKEARAAHKSLLKATALGGYPHSMSRKALKQVLNAGRIFSHTPVSRAAFIATKLAVVSKDAVSAWLETRYGVLPLLGSITGLVDVLVEQARPKRETFRGFARDNDTAKYVSTVENVSGVPGLTTTYIIERTQWVNTRAGVLTEFHPNSLGGKLGTQLRDVPRTLYDLLPLSFVVDWAFDLGTFIEAATPIPGFSWLASWVTCERITQTTYTVNSSGATRNVGGTYPQTQTYFPYEASITVTEKSKFRRPHVEPSLPKPDFKLASTTHVLDSISLAFQRFTKVRVR